MLATDADAADLPQGNTTVLISAAGPAALADADARILAIERRAWRTPGAKALAILDDLGMTEARYYQLLSEIIDKPEALRSDPALVNRLRERRARRAEVRAARLPGGMAS